MTEKISREELERTLETLLREGLVTRVGAGTPEDPYRYYRTEAGSRDLTQKLFRRLYSDG